MSLYVIDAGIGVKWFLTEPHSDKARRLLEQFQQSAIELIAPDLLIAETTNVFWKRAARGDLTALEAEDNLQDLLTINLPLVPSTMLAVRALSLAQTHQRSVYDCLYLALALERGCEMVTSDERFFNAIGSKFSQIKLLHQLIL
jgi:predicted nucleic acid-binding protein